MQHLKTIIMAIIAILFSTVTLSAEEDQMGGKDHPLLTRMPGYFISTYSQNDFDKFDFEIKGGTTTSIEGHFTEIGYRPNDKAASPIQIGRNYQNAITKIGGTVLFEELSSGGGQTTLKLIRDKQEIWVKVRIGDSGNNYTVDIIENAAMEQAVTANADAWKSDINTTGHAAVYGIYFDTDKSEVKVGSEAALKEIATLLKNNPNLKIRLVGHTDCTGDFAHNMTLSEARAKAVMAALTGQYSIAATRLSAHGVGPLSPISSNDTEEGKAKNRRVELVKQ
jgi:outer membrane protein OmpA-like peptidoglycan-associated protein